MENADPIYLPATLIKGHQIASGINPETPYPGGSISLQMPHFRRLGLDLSAFYPATLNLDISPARFLLKKADFRFEMLSWQEGFNPETFSFVQGKLLFDDREYSAFMYYPHPETKTRDFHNNSIIEVLCPFVENIKYGDQVTLVLSSDKIDIQKSNPC